MEGPELLSTALPHEPPRQAIDRHRATAARLREHAERITLAVERPGRHPQHPVTSLPSTADELAYYAANPTIGHDRAKQLRDLADAHDQAAIRIHNAHTRRKTKEQTSR